MHIQLYITAIELALLARAAVMIRLLDNPLARATLDLSVLER
jgi:hypothetical protein